MVEVVITGLGMITPLGTSPGEVLKAIADGRVAGAPPKQWSAQRYPCPECAEIPAFDPTPFVPETKTLRLMSRDALLAVAAARLAVRDAALQVGPHYPPEAVGLFGATGLAGIALSEVTRLIQTAADDRGRLDLQRFGALALKQVRPVLSFKILSNMPLCFVSIFEHLQGANAIFNPWEGQGAQAIASAVRTIRRGEAICALAGGCDVKTHELAFIALQQCGVFESWSRSGTGCTPGEGAVFLVLEEENRARDRGARMYARVRQHRLRTAGRGPDRTATYSEVLAPLVKGPLHAVVAAGDGDPALWQAEQRVLAEQQLDTLPTLHPKKFTGNLFSAAAALQVALAAGMTRKQTSGSRVLANCFGYGSEQGAFVLEAI